MMASTATSKGLAAFGQRLRRVAYNNPIYYGIERSRGETVPTSAAVDRRTQERTRDFFLGTPTSVRATFVRLPMGDSLTLEFFEEDSVLPCEPNKAMADRLVEIVFDGAEPERTEGHQPWTYFLLVARSDDERQQRM